jgi:hypothetical protein
MDISCALLRYPIEYPCTGRFFLVFRFVTPASHTMTIHPPDPLHARACELGYCMVPCQRQPACSLLRATRAINRKKLLSATVACTLDTRGAARLSARGLSLIFMIMQTHVRTLYFLDHMSTAFYSCTCYAATAAAVNVSNASS